MDPIDPSVMTVADFLIFMFEEKKLSPVSVEGYRSDISFTLKYLTQKTVFLIALASGRRHSEIHALSVTSGSVKFSADTSAVVLHFFPGFFWLKIKFLR